jgi:lipoprotein-anchoring transpeptidase ErfK/SrfK
MNEDMQANEQYRQLIKQSMQAYISGNYPEARRLARLAVELMPKIEDAWLLLAASSTKKARLEYLRRALSINPHNQHTREQYRLTMQQPSHGEKTTKEELNQRKAPARQPATPFALSVLAVLPWIIAVFLFCSGFIYFMGNNGDIPPLQNSFVAKQVYAAFYPSNTSSPAQPTIITATPENTSTALPTTTPTETSFPTQTSLPTLTTTPFPTATPKPTITLTPTNPPPVISMVDDRWIDINLSEQKLYAYEMNTVVNTFIVSTGVAAHPTIPGSFRIYIKYITDDMAGPGYYLYDVPYVMYYDKGYGIHGTYWHSNFGTPASHGCTNMKTDDAKWLFNWASMGTLVNIHY